ncbi:hypothetical protein FOCC_FOCC004928, partial [Frankliniella occidentalis]
RRAASTERGTPHRNRDSPRDSPRPPSAPTTSARSSITTRPTCSRCLPVTSPPRCPPCASPRHCAALEAATAMRGIVAFLVLVTCGLVSGSAIPMWEFLSRGEKMSHLFNMFVKQVEDHCDQSTMPDCNKVLMVYGLTNLAKMDDDSLDKMDPYQRGAQDIIWDSMMKGSYKSPGVSPTPSAATSTSPSRRNEAQDVYEDDGELTDGGNSLGGPGSAAQDQDDRFVFGHASGPMVVRVMPDGSPVPGTSRAHLPRDTSAVW